MAIEEDEESWDSRDDNTYDDNISKDIDKEVDDKYIKEDTIENNDKKS